MFSLPGVLFLFVINPKGVWDATKINIKIEGRENKTIKLYIFMKFRTQKWQNLALYYVKSRITFGCL